MQKITAIVLRHRAPVTLAWIVLTVVGGLMVGQANSGLNHQQATPGLVGYDANQAMIRQIGLDGGESPIIAVLRLPQGQTMHTAAGQAMAAGTFAAPAQQGHVGLIDYGTSHNPNLISRDGRTTWALYDMPNPDTGPYTNTQQVIEPALRHAAPAGATVTITGNDALQSVGSGGGSGLSTLDETLIGAAAALIVLGFVYGSAIAVVPLLMALPTILTTFLLLYGLEQLTSVSSLLQYLVAFIGLGIAIDYSLLIVTRWREEREAGKEHTEAIIAASDRAGRAVVLSGLTVAVGLLSLLIIPVQFLQSIGLGSLLIPLCAIATAITLLPVVLSAWGPALDRHRVRRGSTTYSRAWERWANLMVNRRWVAGTVGLVIMVALAIPALSMNTGQANAASLGWRQPGGTRLPRLAAPGRARRGRLAHSDPRPWRALPTPGAPPRSPSAPAAFGRCSPRAWPPAPVGTPRCSPRSRPRTGAPAPARTR